MDEALEKVGLFGCEYGARVTVFGFMGVRIEGHGGILDYTEHEVTVRIHREKLMVRGEKLHVRELSRDELFIAGRISGMEKER